MIRVQITYPAPVVNAVCATQTTTASSQGLILNGTLTNIGSKDIPVMNYSPLAVFPGIQRTVTITSTGNISTSTFSISGYDCKATGLLTTSIAGPNGATATTTTEFNKIVSISVGTLASSPFTIGTGATGTSNWVKTNTDISPFNMTIAVVPATSNPITIQDTQDDSTVANPAVFTHATLVAVTANQESNYAYPVRFTRLAAVATGTATGSSAVTWVQAGISS